MLEKIQEQVSVELIFDQKTRRVFPRLIRWRKRLYKIKKVGLHHLVRKGEILYHIFSATDGNLFFRLALNTQTLHWLLEEVADETVN